MGNSAEQFIPEMLYPNVEELRMNYLSIMESAEFKAEFDHLLKRMWAAQHRCFLLNVFLKVQGKNLSKREDLCHTGALKSTTR